MGTISKPNEFSAAGTIVASEFNDNFDTIYNEFNGSIEAANIAAGAIATAKIADNAVTSDKINASAVVTAKINNGAVTAAKLDSNAIGHGFLEIARTTLGSAGDTITVSSIPARKYLLIYIKAIASGSIGANIQFNGDTGTNYSRRNVVQTTVTTDTSASSWVFNNNTGSENFFTKIEIDNISAQAKLGRAETNQANNSASANPTYISSMGKWANTSAQITSLVVNNTSSGDFNTGSEVIVLGKD